MKHILKLLTVAILLLTSNTYAIAADGGTVFAGQGASGTAIYTPTPQLGLPASVKGTVALANGSASGKYVTLQNLGATTAYNFNLPTTAGTSGQMLLSGGGGSTSNTWSSSPTLTSPVLGNATATTLNKYTFTTPATGATLTIADGKTLTANNTLTINGGDAAILAIAAAKTLTISNTLTLAGTDGQTMTFPAVSDTVAGLGTIQTFSAAQTFSGNANITGSLQLNSLEVPLTPGGRLTLSSTLPVPTADLTAQGTIYYLPYVNQLVPIYNGTHWQEFNIGSSGTNFVLGATNMPTTQVYDVYMVNVSGTPTLCSMYWGGNTARSTTLGGKTGSANASVVQLNGVWVNNAAIATGNCFGGGAGTTSVTIAQNQGTLLGSYYTTGSATTGVAFKPAGASGGSNNIIGLSNAYNRITQTALMRETATAFTIASTTFAQMNASAADRITWVDSLQQSPVVVRGTLVGGDATAGSCAAYGVVLDATSGTPNVVGQGCAGTATIADNYSTLSVSESFYPQLGLHFVQAEVAALVSGTSTFNPVATQNGLTADIQW